jgi:aspartyl-tRNA(Asn)/glutamyl-tRNA(Gln) amidotransferase subunit B
LEIETEDANGEMVAKTIGITRAHLEEDAGKSLHEDFHGLTGIDLNRAGTPLLEIVSEPDMRSATEAVAYMKKIHALVRYLEICDGNMQEGSFRCDANVSVRPKGQKALGTRAELKNLNSFRFIERAINIEVERQIDILEGGGEIVQETRLYDADRNETRSMRSKEEAFDYRYFPDPDLLPVVISDDDINSVRATLPELPAAKQQRFISGYELSAKDAGTLTSSRDLADYFEQVTNSSGEAKLAANWVLGDLLGMLNKEGLELGDCPVTAEQLGGMLQRISDNTISGKIAKQVFEAMWAGEGDADQVIEAKGLKQITDTGAIEAIIDEIIANNPGQVEQYRSGKDKLFGFFVGQTMKATQGKANPAQVNELLKRKLEG